MRLRRGFTKHSLDFTLELNVSLDYRPSLQGLSLSSKPTSPSRRLAELRRLSLYTQEASTLRGGGQISVLRSWCCQESPLCPHPQFSFLWFQLPAVKRNQKQMTLLLTDGQKADIFPLTSSHHTDFSHHHKRKGEDSTMRDYMHRTFITVYYHYSILILVIVNLLLCLISH